MLICGFWMLQDGNEIFFSINKSTHLKKLMNAYCNHHSVDFNSIGFMFNEHHVQAEQSPNEVRARLHVHCLLLCC